MRVHLFTTTMNWLVLFISMQLVACSATDNVPCPTKCICDLKTLAITCTGIGGEKIIGIKFPTNYTKLILAGNGMTKFPPKEHFVNNSFNTISLANNMLKEIPDFPDGVTNINLDSNTIFGLITANNFTSWCKDAASITIQNNEITEVDENTTAACAAGLTLYLIKNQIQELPRNAFSQSKVAEEVSLFGNQIRSIAAGAFSNVKKVDLRNNSLKSISADWFADNTTEILYLADNDFTCGCNLLENFTKVSKVMQVRDGKCWNRATQRSEYLREEDQSCKPCDYVSCQHGGTCSAASSLSSSDEFSCACPEGYHGRFCEIKEIKPCDYVSCQHGGTCSAASSLSSSHEFSCACPKGYHGHFCEIKEIKPCDYVSCQHGGTCSAASSLSSSDEFSCACPEGYQGRFCEIEEGKEVIRSASSCFQPSSLISTLFYALILLVKMYVHFQ